MGACRFFNSSEFMFYAIMLFDFPAELMTLILRRDSYSKHKL
jgi:hypothetical protein